MELIIIGSGPAGYAAAIRAAQLGIKTTVIERAETGGICVNWGCIPTKALLKSAQVLQYAQHAALYGVRIDGAATPDLAAIVARSRAVAAGINKGVEFMLNKNNVTLVAGTAALTPGGGVRVTAANGSTQTLLAAHTIVATGARAHSLACAPIDGTKIIGYRQALTPARIPATMAVIGSGAMGCELAYFYHCMGAQVTLIEYMESAQLSRSFRKAGIKVITGAQVESINKSGKRCRVQLQTKKGEERLSVDMVLSAVGVVPNIEGLGLETLGIETEKRGIKVNERYQTNIEGVYAVGDVIATPALAHVASAEAVNCVERMAGLDVPPVDYRNIPSCIYSTPEIG